MFRSAAKLAVRGCRASAGVTGKTVMAGTRRQMSISVNVEQKALFSELGEGSMWWAERSALLFLDIMKGHIKIYNPESGELDIHHIGKPVGTVVLRNSSNSDEAILLGTKDGIEEYNVETRKLVPLAPVEAELDGNRANDGKCDPQGRFWLGTMSLTLERGAGHLWFFDENGKVSQRCSEHSFSVCNGITWSQDLKHMYFVDSPVGLYHFDYNAEDGQVSNGSVILPDADVADGFCDGTTMDSDGNLWIAHWEGGCVSQWRVNGKEKPTMLQQIAIPGAKQLTSVAFGGPTLEDLYVTSAYIDLSPEAREQQENAGCVFRVNGHGARGLPPHRYGKIEPKARL